MTFSFLIDEGAMKKEQEKNIYFWKEKNSQVGEFDGSVSGYLSFKIPECKLSQLCVIWFFVDMFNCSSARKIKVHSWIYVGE